MTTTSSPSTAGSPGTAGSPVTETAPRGGIDPRGPQVAAAITTVVLAAVLLTPEPVATVLLGVQAVVFGLGVVLGVARSPYAWVFRTLVRPRLGPPGELEDPRPPRFAQAVGLVFAVFGLAGYVSGALLLGQVFVGLALAAAFLNAAFAYCLGCEVFLAATRLGAVGARRAP